MYISIKEMKDFPQKYNWMLENLTKAHESKPSVLEVLAAIMVMEREDPTKLVELITEIKKEIQ
jgi:hypothetical protein